MVFNGASSDEIDINELADEAGKGKQIVSNKVSNLLSNANQSSFASVVREIQRFVVFLNGEQLYPGKVVVFTKKEVTINVM